MTAEQIPWFVAFLAISLMAFLGVVWLMRQRRGDPPPLPNEWALTARPVFNSDERRVYRQLREALPYHVILSKLPLVRFCQPTDPQQVRYWYELLGSTHVAFAICSANGRVLAALDIDSERTRTSPRAVQIKQKVLAACRVRYLRCPIDHLPSVPELQLLVPQQMTAARGPLPATVAAPGGGVAAPRRETRALWQDSGFLQDSFFGPDSRMDGAGASEFGSLLRPMTVREFHFRDDEPVQSPAAAADTPPGTPPVRH